MAKIILFDSTKINGRAQILFTFSAAATYTLAAKADLIDDDATVLQQLQIERIRWNSASTITDIELSYAGATAIPIMELVGSGHWYHDLAITPEKIKTARNYGYAATGDLVLTASATPGDLTGTITGAKSGATAAVASGTGATYALSGVSGTFIIGEVITDGTDSGTLSTITLDPLATENGDIIVEAKGSGNATVILDVRKIKGYVNRSDYGN